MCAAPKRWSTLACVAALACCLAPAAAAQGTRASPAVFVAVEWGASVDSVLFQATRAGWSFVRVDEDSDYVFRGVVDGEEAVAFAAFGPKGLARFHVGVAPHPAAAFTYRRIADSLSARFGGARLIASEESGVRPAPLMVTAAAWPGLMMGLRRDGWITLIFTCPESSPRLPEPRGPVSLQWTRRD